MSEEPFKDLLGGLRAQGRAADAEALESLMVAGWKSAPEMVDELGLAILDLEVPPTLREAKRGCMDIIRALTPNSPNSRKR